MSTPTDGETSQLRELCAEAETLARKLPGGMSRLTVRAGEFKVEVEWAVGPVAAPAPGAPAGVVAMAAPAEAAAAEEEAPGHRITAPLVGTFYRSPEPGADPFVTEGGPIEVGQDVCIVEAMKIMNRVESDVTGIVREILVADGEIVEYGQALMIVDLDGAQDGS